ncbi:MAG: hypothetical protein HYV96_10540 [Opitutae bacterium]|nr:hypothetical protein [Opitutae bacterium]
MSKKPKIGRPQLPSDEKKKVVPIRLSEREIEELKKVAGGAPLSTWMRETLIGRAEAMQPKRKPQH